MFGCGASVDAANGSAVRLAYSPRFEKSPAGGVVCLGARSTVAQSADCFLNSNPCAAIAATMMPGNVAAMTAVVPLPALSS